MNLYSLLVKVAFCVMPKRQIHDSTFSVVQ